MVLDPRTIGDRVEVRADHLAIVTVLGECGEGRVLVGDEVRLWEVATAELIGRPDEVADLEVRLYDEGRRVAHLDELARRQRAIDALPSALASLERSTRESLESVVGEAVVGFEHDVDVDRRFGPYVATRVTVPLDALQRLMYLALAGLTVDSSAGS